MKQEEHTEESMVFPVVMYRCESWTRKKVELLKNWCFWTVVLEKTLESPLDSKEIKPVNPKGNQSWIFIGRADAEAPIHWPPDVKSLLIGKDLDAGKDWGQERRGQQRMRWLNGVTGSMDMRNGPLRRLSAEELMLLNCGAGEDSWESLGLQGDQTSQS